MGDIIVMRILGRDRVVKEHPTWNVPKWVPMEILSDTWSKHIHSQSLNRLNERGGLSIEELIANIEAQWEKLQIQKTKDKIGDRNILTFGDLQIGDCFISFPIEGDNEGHGGYLGKHYVFRKTGLKTYQRVNLELLVPQDKDEIIVGDGALNMNIILVA